MKEWKNVFNQQDISNCHLFPLCSLSCFWHFHVCHSFLANKKIWKIFLSLYYYQTALKELYGGLHSTHGDKNTKDNYVLSDTILQIKWSGYLSIYNRKPDLFQHNTHSSFYLNIPNRVIQFFFIIIILSLHCSLFTYLWTVLRLSLQSLLWLCPLMDRYILE